MKDIWRESRWRSLAMQSSLVVVFGLTLALAMGVRAFRQRHSRVDLGPTQRVGRLAVQPPARWQVHQDVNGVALGFDEPSEHNHPGRQLVVGQATAPCFLSPLEYLVRNGDLQRRDVEAMRGGGGGDDQEDSPAFRAITVGGWPGVLISHTRLFRTAGLKQPVPWKDVLACAVLPSHDVIVLRLTGEGMADWSDEDLLRRVAETACLDALVVPSHGGEVELGGELKFVAPSRVLTAAADADKLRGARAMVDVAAPGWVSAEAVGCVWPAGEKGPTLATMMMWRDPAFRPGEIVQLDEMTWVTRRRGDGLFPGAAFVRASPGGRAILVEFRWALGEADADSQYKQVESLWRTLEAQMRLADAEPIEPMMRAGAAALRALPEDAAVMFGPMPSSTRPARPESPELPAGGIPQQRWQWFSDTSSRTSWMTTAHRVVGAAALGETRVDRSPPLGAGGLELYEWKLMRDYSGYDFFARRAAGPFQEFHAAGSKFRSVLAEGTNVSASAAGDLPPNFIPGATLPWVLGRLPFERMMLYTDWTPTPASASALTPLPLLLEPAFDHPKTPAGESEALRCWRVEVPGSGWSSRWYVDAQGRLESIKFPGGVGLQSVEAEPLEGPSATRGSTTRASTSTKVR